MDKAKILRLCNEIEMIMCEIYNTGHTMQNCDYEAVDKGLKAIVAEITASPKTNGDFIRQMTDEELCVKMPELIDKNALQEALREEYDRHKALYDEIGHIERGGIVQGLSYAKMILCKQPTIEAEPVRRGRWIECDYKELRHGEIWTEHRAGLCCSECRTGFKKNHMTYKAFCPACGARMDGGADNAESD